MSARPHPSSALWAFVDLLFNAFFIVVCLYVMEAMLPHLKAAEDAKKAGISPGKMCVSIYWPDASPADIDLWARGPDDKIVGYKNKSAPLMDLLRDDLGTLTDPSDHHFEMICTRSLMKGNWTFNAHYYAPHGDVAEVPVTIVVSFPIGVEHVRSQPEMTTKAVLQTPGQEVTLLDFELDDAGQVVPGSANSVFQPIRDKGVGP